MTFAQRLAEIRARLGATQLDCVVAVHDGAHFIEKPDPVLVLTGFKALGPVAAVLDRAGAVRLCGDPVHGIAIAPANLVGMRRSCRPTMSSPVCNRRSVYRALAPKSASPGWRRRPMAWPRACAELLPQARPADALVFEPAQRKIDTELAHAEEATRIAELGLRHLLELARPGMTEDELAMELRWHSKSLGAEDNFVLLCAGPHNKAVAPSHGRRLREGDIIVCELTPSYRGQLAQICRTVVLGEAPAILREKYDLVRAAMTAGFAAAMPGVPMADGLPRHQCGAGGRRLRRIRHPPHIRRRGHGLGFRARPGRAMWRSITISFSSPTCCS